MAFVLVLGHVLGLASSQREAGKVPNSYESTRLQLCMKAVETSLVSGVYQFAHDRIHYSPCEVGKDFSKQYNWISAEAQVGAAEINYVCQI